MEPTQTCQKCNKNETSNIFFISDAAFQYICNSCTGKLPEVVQTNQVMPADSPDNPYLPDDTPPNYVDAVGADNEDESVDS